MSLPNRCINSSRQSCFHSHHPTFILGKLKWILKIGGKLFDETFLRRIAFVKTVWSAVVCYLVAEVSNRFSAMHLVLSLLSHSAKVLVVSTRPPNASCIVDCEKVLDFVTRVFTLIHCYILAFGRGKTCRMTAVTGTLNVSWVFVGWNGSAG